MAGDIGSRQVLTRASRSCPLSSRRALYSKGARLTGRSSQAITAREPLVRILPEGLDDDHFNWRT